MQIPMSLMSAMRVDYEVCEAFRSAIEHDEPVCSTCGYLAGDHEPPDAVVVRLPQRPVRRPAPARKAS